MSNINGRFKRSVDWGGGMTENLLHYFKDNQLDEVEERFQADLEYHQEKIKEIKRKLAFLAIERARRDDKDIR